jgi:prohibitin 1
MKLYFKLTTFGVAESILKVAEAQAKANKVLAESITPDFLQYQALEKWDGKLPTTMVPVQATPFISVK